MTSPLKPGIQTVLRWGPGLGLALLLVLSVPRFLLVLWANQSGRYGLLSGLMVLMALLPWLMLSRAGRRAIGIQRPARTAWLVYGFLLGAMLALLLYAVGYALFRHGPDHWYQYISRTFTAAREGIHAPADKHIYFVIYALTSMLFSPLGEESYFRGLVHGCFSVRFGDRRASQIDSLAFALVHLAHYGLLFEDGQWRFAWMGVLPWMAGMYAAGRLFHTCRMQSGSLWGAVLSHAGFNLSMTACIFYGIFP